MHILAIGQSNLANHCGTAQSSSFGEALAGGRLYPLSDPVQGGTGTDNGADFMFGNAGLDDTITYSSRTTRVNVYLEALLGGAPGRGALTQVGDWIDVGAIYPG